GTFMIAAAIAGEPGATIRITKADPTLLGDVFTQKFRETGIAFNLGTDYVDVVAPETIHPVSIETGIYPCFPTDLQAQWTVLMTQAEGTSEITDTIYLDRFKHVPELERMGIRARVRGNTVTVQGRRPLQGAKVMSTDLRGSVALVLAGMLAEGTTDVLRVYHLDRGYENLEGKLADVGAQIHREPYDEFATPEPQDA
ncbi:MAG: UDP-N-acetylglucosamine 1-carboxyvinyltransferase, partial [Rhodothermales bacterium]